MMSGSSHYVIVCMEKFSVLFPGYQASQVSLSRQDDWVPVIKGSICMPHSATDMKQLVLVKNELKMLRLGRCFSALRRFISSPMDCC